MLLLIVMLITHIILIIIMTFDEYAPSVILQPLGLNCENCISLILKGHFSILFDSQSSVLYIHLQYVDEIHLSRFIIIHLMKSTNYLNILLKKKFISCF